MKLILFFLLLLLSPGQAPRAWASENPTEPAPLPVLVISTYDSFMTRNGLGTTVFPLFEKKCGCKIRVLVSGDAGQLLSRLQMDAERGKVSSHLVLGLDQTSWQQAKAYTEEWGRWRPKGFGAWVPELRGAAIEPGFLPFDYGLFAFIADREALATLKLEAPKRLSDLLKPEWRRSVILEDPRTSSPGLAFMLYADAIGGPDFWVKFRTKWLTLAPGWDGAYGLFLKKEAPLVWSYLTSQAYHEEHGDAAGRYRALALQEGSPLQIEGVAIEKGAFALRSTGDESADADAGGGGEMAHGNRARELARSFLAFMLSPEVQSQVPLTNWMLPVVPGIKLPKSFEHLPKVARVVRPPTDPAAVERELKEWKHSVGLVGL